MDRQDLLELLPDYVLGLLSEAEAAQIHDLLVTNEAARREVTAFQVVMEGLAFSVPYVAPPPHLADQLRHATNRRASTHPRNRLFLISGLAAILALVFGVWFINRPTDDNDTPSLADQFAELSDDPQGVQVALVPDETFEAVGALRFRAGSSEAIIQVSNLPPLAPNQAYQVWIVDAEGPNSGGIFQFTDTTNYVRLNLNKPVEEYVRFGMTIEPDTGSPLINRPSGTRIFNIQLRDESE